MLSMIEVGAVSTSALPIVLGSALAYGGLLQLLAGMWAFVRHNTFAAVALGSYGAFWISYWAREALAHPGPVVVEAVVDPNEPPLPAKITSEQAKALGEALVHGEEHRRRIGLTIGRQLIDERTFAASPYGVTERVKESIAGAFGRGGEDD